jgi:hypothetical protein
MSFGVDSSVPSEAVRGEPDGGDDVSFEEALLFAADVVGGLKFLLTTKADVGFAS